LLSRKRRTSARGREGKNVASDSGRTSDLDLAEGTGDSVNADAQAAARLHSINVNTLCIIWKRRRNVGGTRDLGDQVALNDNSVKLGVEQLTGINRDRALNSPLAAYKDKSLHNINFRLGKERIPEQTAVEGER